MLTAEENFHQYFANLRGLPDGDYRKAIHARYGMPSRASERKWENFHDRFDVAKEPNEGFRFGWIVEFDPYNPNSVPVKRTWLGRFRHEAATFVIAPSGQVVAYSATMHAASMSTSSSRTGATIRATVRRTSTSSTMACCTLPASTRTAPASGCR